MRSEAHSSWRPGALVMALYPSGCFLTRVRRHRWAAKEAAFKALSTGLPGQGRVPFPELLVSSGPGGPTLSLQGSAREHAELHAVTDVHLR